MEDKINKFIKPIVIIFCILSFLSFINTCRTVKKSNFDILNTNIDTVYTKEIKDIRNTLFIYGNDLSIIKKPRHNCRGFLYKVYR